jgi:hypothetical protein
MNECNPARLYERCKNHIPYIYPKRGRVSIKRRPTIQPCRSETGVRAQEGKDQQQGETIGYLRAILARTLADGLFPKSKSVPHSSVAA